MRPLNPTTGYTATVIYKQFTTPAPSALLRRPTAGPAGYPLSAATALNRGARTRASFSTETEMGLASEARPIFPDINHAGSRAPCVVTVLPRMGIIDETRN